MRFSFLALVGILAVIYSCNKEDSPPSNEDTEYVLKEGVFFIDEESESQLDSIGNDALYFLGNTKQLDSIKIGDVYVGGGGVNQGQGFIRIITGIETWSGGPVYFTQGGGLTDVFCYLNFDYQTDIKTLGNRTFPVNTHVLKGIIFDKDGNTSATTNDQIGLGFGVEYTVKPILKILINNCKIEYLKIGADIEGEANLDAYLDASLGSFKVDDMPIFDLEIFLTQTFIGPIPLTFNLVPRPVIGGEVFGSIELNLKEKGKRSFYSEYESGVWKNESSAELEEMPFPVSSEFGVNFKCGIALNIEAQIADFDDARASIGGTLFGELMGSVEVGSGVKRLDVKACIELGVSVVAKAFSRFILIDYEHVFKDHCFWENTYTSEDPCFDGIQNYDETGVDCGGANCSLCPCNHEDVLALKSFFDLANGPNWKNKDGWLEDCDPCKWFGVSCNTEGRVTGLILANNNLTGKLTTDINALSFLKHLNLNDNFLSGDIPSSLYLTNKLINLQLSGNYLDGEISFAIENMKDLKLLNLSMNNISGKLPVEISSLQNLEVLNLRKNHFEGCIPNEYLNFCSIDVNLEENLLLPNEGDFNLYCSSKIGACRGCQDQNAHNYNPFSIVEDNSECETCFDGKLNGDEVEVDCGGTKCAECGTCDLNMLIDSRDGEKYKTTQIGNQVWMAENLRYKTYHSICLDNEELNCIKYGRLYDRYALTNDQYNFESNSNPSGFQGICPEGWHVPSYDEIIELFNFINPGMSKFFVNGIHHSTTDTELINSLVSNHDNYWGIADYNPGNNFCLSVLPLRRGWQWCSCSATNYNPSGSIKFDTFSGTNNFWTISHDGFGCFPIIYNIEPGYNGLDNGNLSVYLIADNCQTGGFFSAIYYRACRCIKD